MLRGLLLGEALRAGEGPASYLGRCVPTYEGHCRCLCGEEALAFCVVCGEGFEDDSVSCIVPVCVELGHGWMGASYSNVGA